MSEHDEAGSAVAFPPLLLLPPPPQPAARSASTAVRPISAASNGLLLTLPPRSPDTGFHAAVPGAPAPRGGKYWGIQRLMQARTAATVGLRRSGGTGRRAGLKIRWGQPRVGSSPTFGTYGLRRGARRPDPGASCRRARRHGEEDVRG